MDAERAGQFRIGYNLLWRVTFLALGIFLIVAAVLEVVDKLALGASSISLPFSMLIASVFLGIYLMPLIASRPQIMEVANDGLKLFGDRSTVVVPWTSVADVRFKRVMLLMRYLVISLKDEEPLIRFLDENPRSFLARWTSHVSVFRRYPWIIRKVMSVPKVMTTANQLKWLDRRYGGAIVIDSAAVNGRGSQLEQAIRAKLG